MQDAHLGKMYEDLDSNISVENSISNKDFWMISSKGDELENILFEIERE